MRMVYAYEEEEKASEGGVSADGGDHTPNRYPASSRGFKVRSESSHISSLHIASGDCVEDDVNAARNADKMHKNRIFALSGIILVLVIVLAVSIAMLFEGRKEAGQQQYASLQFESLQELPAGKGQQGLLNDEGPRPLEAIRGEEEKVLEEEGRVMDEKGAPAEQGILVWIPSKPTTAPSTTSTISPTTDPTADPTTAAPTESPTESPTKSSTKRPTASDEDGLGEEDNEDEMHLAAWDP